MGSTIGRGCRRRSRKGRPMTRPNLAVILALAGNIVLATTANILLKFSADASSPAAFVAFQIAGNLAGLGGILAYTSLLARMPIHVAFPLTQGAAALSIAFVGSVVIFRESFTLREALGFAAVAAGILLIGTEGGATDGIDTPGKDGS